MEGTFVRQLELDVLKTKVLKLPQKIEGDVSCIVRDAAIILAKYLEKLSQELIKCFKHLNIIELRTGVGCVGLTAACLETNKAFWKERHGYARAVSLEWGKKTEFKFSPDIILLADYIYYKESVRPLVNTLKELTSSNTEILLAQELRNTEKQVECWKFFIQTVQEFFSIYNIPIAEQHPE